MKSDVASFVNKCLVCQKVKAKHQRPSRMLQPLEIPKWKWKSISMDFAPFTSKEARKLGVKEGVVFLLCLGA